MSYAEKFASATAQILLDTSCITFAPKQPFTLTSGRKSPVYVDCRRLIGFPQARERVIEMGYDLLQETLQKPFDCIAGGETAGIAYAAWMASKFNLPMAYIRKKPKGFGKNARIEGNMYEGQNVLLVEDLFTDGGSKFSFLDAIAEAGAVCHCCFVIFRYGIFPEQEKEFAKRNVRLMGLTSWKDVMAQVRVMNLLDDDEIKIIENFLANPEDFS